MAERHPATDLRGMKASDDSFTTSMTSPAEACRVDFQSGLFSCTAVGSTAGLESFASLLSLESGTGSRWPETDGAFRVAPPVTPKQNCKDRFELNRLPTLLTVRFPSLQCLRGRLG